MARTIFHCDCNGFYASVECIFRPEPKGAPWRVRSQEPPRHHPGQERAGWAGFRVQTAETVWQASANARAGASESSITMPTRRIPRRSTPSMPSNRPGKPFGWTSPGWT